MTSNPLPSPFDDAVLYDLMMGDLDFDLEFWRGVAKESGGPVLDVGCGTGRITLALLGDGHDVDGVDLSEPMLERLRVKARNLGHSPSLLVGDMRNFTMPRRYARVICGFNSFAHNLTTADQLAALRNMRGHLTPGGAAVIHMSYPDAELWTCEEGIPILEHTAPNPRTNGTIRIYDTRRLNRIEQTQHSVMEIQELDAAGVVVARHPSETHVRWIFKPELELLMVAAGFSRWDIVSGHDRLPVTQTRDPMYAIGWG
ncbi:MAG: class I SAM-dependent methyltransferase [Planctomycetes bacterium]|nr:class I SAM-dependent methyltransferase [Planctomycetota bacterium]